MHTLKSSIVRSTFVLGPILLAVAAAQKPRLVLSLIILAGVGVLVLACRAWLHHKGLVRQAARMNAQLANSPCRYMERFGILEEVKVMGSLLRPHILLGMNLFAEENNWRQLVADAAVLRGPRHLSQVSTSQACITFLEHGGIHLLSEHSVEAKITSAAVDCVRQARWSEQALQQLQELRVPLMLTMERARGNTLLEPSLPKLKDAQEALRNQERQLRAALGESLDRLQTLREFLMVPAQIRPMIDCDLDELLGSRRFETMRQAYDRMIQIDVTLLKLVKEDTG